VLDQNDPFYYCSEPFRVEKLTEIWLEHGIPLSHRACLGAIADWGGSTNEVTHLVAATGSVQCHPGPDAYIAQRLKLPPNVSRTLLSGVGCAGAVALLRTAYELATAMACRGKPARILVVACDLNSLGFRSDFEQLKKGHFPVGLTLFSDAATAAVVSNGIGTHGPVNAHPPFEIQQWMHHTIPNSLGELQLMPTAIGKHTPSEYG
jgi:fungal type III polyketide synthase